MRGVTNHGRLLQLNPREDQKLTNRSGVETRRLCSVAFMSFSLATETKLAPPLRQNNTFLLLHRLCRAVADHAG
jgi:hypothetical protein